MLTNNMTLQKMLEFKPSDYDMVLLDLDVVCYIRCSIVSLFKEDNYDFIKFLFLQEDIGTYFKEIKKTVIYDFDGTKTSGERFITVFELYSLFNANNTSEYLKEILETYNHVADVIIDIFTHDNKMYRLSNLDGIVKLEEI